MGSVRNFRVWRGDAAGGRLEDFQVEVNEGEVVLDIIHRLQATQAPDLAVRWNCKAGKCGSCSMEINGKPGLSCMTRMSALPEDGAVTVTPIRTFPVIRDLVSDVSFNYAKARELPAFAPPAGLAPGGYLLLTFHRQENVDSKERLSVALDALDAAAKEADRPIVFPIHPRTAKRLREFGLEKRAASMKSLRRIEPTGYLDMLRLEKGAALVMTDSGGLQEESCFFHVPCVTLRANTERPETLEIGSNVLAGTDPARVRQAVKQQLGRKREWPNPYGDGTTSRKIAALVDEALG